MVTINTNLYAEKRGQRPNNTQCETWTFEVELRSSLDSSFCVIRSFTEYGTYFQTSRSLPGRVTDWQNRMKMPGYIHRVVLIP